MKHEHNHSCQCEHKQVRFCKHCNICYCLDCNVEWAPRLSYTWYNQPNTWRQNIYDQTTSGGAGGINQAVQTVAATACNHRG